MATLSNRNGTRYIQFVNRDGERKSIGLGRMSDRDARTVLAHVGHLSTARIVNGAPPPVTAQWLADIGDDLYERLARVGLVLGREKRRAVELASFIDGYIKGRHDLKPNTIRNLQQTRRLLVKFFHAHRDITAINRGEAKDWGRWLAVKQKLAVATVATHVKKAREFFADAIDRQLIADNPFEGVDVGTQANDARKVYVSPADIEAVIAVCPDAEWRLVFALARYGGLRIPSESSQLRWSDIDWGRKRFTVRSSKTARYEGKDRRVVPLFPELESHLLAAHALAEAGDDRVVARLRRENLRTHGERIVDRAGLVPWPKLFQNLRASRQTDLAGAFPAHVVCKWMGNTEAVAKNHYLMVKEEHFAQASEMRAAPGAVAGGGNAGQTETEKHENPRKSGGSRDDEYPQGESNKGAVSQLKREFGTKALRGALRRLSNTNSTQYDKGTQHLRTRKSGRAL